LIPDHPDSQIAEGLKQGSSDAFRTLFVALGPGILAYLTRLTGRKEMAEELTQDTFLTALRKISFFRAGPKSNDGGLKAWVFRIATHLAIDVIRREKKVALPALAMGDDDSFEPAQAAFSTSSDDPEVAFGRFEFSQALNAALLELAPAQRMIFLLREQEELSLLEISRVCGCNENAVKQSLFRARTALKKRLGGMP
jgi:RNA polymerase sigma-70 factor (ECF subfamily)